MAMVRELIVSCGIQTLSELIDEDPYRVLIVGCVLFLIQMKQTFTNCDNCDLAIFWGIHCLFRYRVSKPKTLMPVPPDPKISENSILFQKFQNPDNMVIIGIMTIIGGDMSNSISVAEAKTAFSECIRQVEKGAALIITKHGKPVAALVPPDEVEQLERLRKAGPEKGLAGIAGGWEGSEELADIVEGSARQGQRNVPELG
jgi:prevent-host-death family protein